MTLFAARDEIEAWFEATVGPPTPVQRAAWPVLRGGSDALVIAATGQGKTLAGWRPVVERLADARHPKSGVRALHVAPLKALARDMVGNLQPLLRAAGAVRGRPMEIALRCGDTPASERSEQRRRPPEILSTTPESLFVLLGSVGGRRMLRGVESVVVDELHALAGDKRGAHLALSLARLECLTGRPVQRIGLSATASPTRRLAAFLAGGRPCEIVDGSAGGVIDLRVELPAMRLGAFPTTVHWAQIHARIADMAVAGAGDPHPESRHAGVADEAARPEASRERPVNGTVAGSLLVFCQTRAQVERTAAALDELLAEAGHSGQVAAHHGSLDTAHRQSIERRFKAGELHVMVSSASLELGLDVGSVDRVCQIGVPGSANLARQRAGRSGHGPGRTPRLHLFPLTANQLVEAHALGESLRKGIVEDTEVPAGPEDVLQQHLVAAIAAGMQAECDLLAMARAAWPYREWPAERLSQVLAQCSEPAPDLPPEQGRRLLERAGSGRWRARPGTATLTLVNAGTIPEFFEYDVVRDDTGERVGTLDEEFAFESSPGQIVQLGRRAWRIERVRTGEVRVTPSEEDAMELPFWFGEGPGRSAAMASAVLDAMARHASSDLHPQAVSLLSESRRVLGALPSRGRLVIERFPDPNGDRHVVLHTFAGARINRAWGLALRKRFCRQFNFELQAAATDDGVLISLGVTSRFDVADVARFVKSGNVADVLTQALLDTPLFVTRFRWVANNALVLLKNDLHGRIPAQRQRSQAENLIACVFPDQLACLENLSGPREVPDHPLVQQALADCLADYMDLDGLQRYLARIESGALAVHAVDLPEPSPLAQALIHAPRHSYLDEAAAEERRTRNFERPAGRRGGAPRTATGRNREASPPVRMRSAFAPAVARPSADALESLLARVGFLTAREGEAGLGLDAPAPAGGWTRWFSQLVRDRRAVSLRPAPTGPNVWVAVPGLAGLLALCPGAEIRPWIAPALIPPERRTRDAVLAALIASRRSLEGDSAAATVHRLFGPLPVVDRATG